MLVPRRLARFGIVLAALSGLAAAQPPRPLVVVCRLDSEIHPAAADFLKKSISRAEQEKASLLVIELSTPGGLMTSMREITTAIVNSKVPVATYVYPSGARAASAGFFVLLAGDVAAMAPGTNTGAAHPVGGRARTSRRRSARRSSRTRSPRSGRSARPTGGTRPPPKRP